MGSPVRAAGERMGIFTLASRSPLGRGAYHAPDVAALGFAACSGSEPPPYGFVRHFFTNLQLCISDGNNEKALEMISAFSEKVESTAIMHFCKNSTINYVVSAFAEKFKEKEIKFNCSIKIEDLDIDEINFASIVSNALENAYNAQLDLPVSKRKIDLMLCNKDEKILFSIRNFSLNS